MVDRASDNPFPSVLFAEHVDPANPPADHQRLFVDTDHTLKLINSSGTVTALTGGMADPMTTRGDMIIRNASNATARLGRGSSGQVLTSDGTDIAWATPTSGGITQAFLGYNTIGGTWETTASNSTWYLKQITPANACLITSVGAYLQHASGTGAGPAVGLWSDSGGHPLMWMGGSPRSQATLNLNTNGARWIDMPLGIWVASGTYWIGVRTTDLNVSATVAMQIAYDSGSDETKVQSDIQALDIVSSTVTARKYSIRANTIR